MIGTLVLIFGIGLVVVVVGLGVVGHLQRIAEAIEAQNRAYGVSAGKQAEQKEAA